MVLDFRTTSCKSPWGVVLCKKCMVLTTVVGGLILRASRYVCADKKMFYSFRAIKNGEKLYMSNSATANIKGERDVIWKITFEKELKLTNVLYVQEIRNNPVHGWVLNKFAFRLVFESDKFVLSKNQMYVGKGYALN
nr:zinc finger, CCHC-type [Tanacetum cinerariifolium]